MPSTLVHVALAGLVACALLHRAFSVRALAVVLGAVVLIDFDVFVGWFVLGAHRAAFHTLLLPAAVALALAADLLVADRSRLIERFGETAPRVGGVAVTAVVVAGILPDLVTNGANLLWPVHDQFYVLDGKARLSDRRGLLQTFVEQDTAQGSTEETQFRTGADPDPGETQSVQEVAESATGGDGGGDGGQEEAPERVFLLVNSGLELLLVAAGTAITSFRTWELRRE
jgi:inner membrane protein